MQKIYFDNGSTSFPKAPRVGEAMARLLEQGAFNINRGSYEGAYELAGVVLDTREKLARLFHGDLRQVVFTPGITYSLNYLIKGLLKRGDHVVTTSMEHNAVMRPLIQMEEYGISYTCVQADREGSVRAADFEKAIRPETKLVIVNHVSNVSGTIQPLEEIGKICKKKGVYFAADTAQSAGTLPIDMEKMNLDFLAFTGHKGLLGPQGIGGFLISQSLNKEMKPLIAGGTGSHSDLLTMPEEMPDKYESGTMNLPGIVGLHAALSYLEEQGIDRLSAKKRKLLEYALEEIGRIDGVRIVGKQGLEDRTAVLSLDFEKTDNAQAAFCLEQEYGIMTRVGLHCAPMAHRSLGTFPQGTVRVAFSAENTREEVEVLVKAVKAVS